MQFFESTNSNLLSKNAVNKLYENIKLNSKYGGGGGKYKSALTKSGLTKSEVNIKLNKKNLDNPDILKPHIQTIWILQNAKCCKSGIKLEEKYLFSKNQHILAPSIDRIDNDKGYEVGNIQIVMRGINRFKNLTNDIEFVEILKDVAKSVVVKYNLEVSD
jgi:hypothetical protein